MQSASSCRLLLTEGRPQAVGRRQAVQTMLRWVLSEGIGERAALLQGACLMGWAAGCYHGALLPC